MTKTRIFVCAAAALVGNGTVASAGPPEWCRGQRFEISHEKLYLLSKGDPAESLETLAKYQCSDSEEANSHRAELDKARDAWGAKYGLRDADWADMIAWTTTSRGMYPSDLPIVNRDFASLSPIDQYIAIARGNSKEGGQHWFDQLYMTDILDAQLTQTGRLGYINWCLDEHDGPLPDDNVVTWAVCQSDIDKFDANKVFDEVRGDTAHDGIARMFIRLQAHDIAKRIKDNADKKAALIKQDGEYGRIYTVAATAQADWSKGIGANGKLFELVRDVEAGQFFHSRKLLDGCEAKTQQALADAVAKLPAKSFAGMANDFFKGGAVLAKEPNVFVAAIAFIDCQPKSSTARLLINAITGAPGVRGPRSAALDAIMTTTFKFDDTTKKGAKFPQLKDRPYYDGESMGSHPMTRAIASVKAGKDSIEVTFDTKKRMQVDCVKEHRGRLAAIRSDGSLEYEIICDKTETRAHDDSGGITGAKFGHEFGKWLKPGALVSFYWWDGQVLEALAVWPTKTATTPSMVLGGGVK